MSLPQNLTLWGWLPPDHQVDSHEMPLELQLHSPLSPSFPTRKWAREPPGLKAAAPPVTEPPSYPPVPLLPVLVYPLKTSGRPVLPTGNSALDTNLHFCKPHFPDLWDGSAQLGCAVAQVLALTLVGPPDLESEFCHENEKDVGHLNSLDLSF